MSLRRTMLLASFLLASSACGIVQPKLQCPTPPPSLLEPLPPLERLPDGASLSDVALAAVREHNNYHLVVAQCEALMDLARALKELR